MGSMRFLVPRREHLAPDAVERAYFSGLDEIPWQSQIQWTDEGLELRRSESDSGNFHMPWPVGGHGELMLSTSSLMERSRPYHLPVELVRGTVNRVRQHAAQWEASGLVVPEEVTRCLKLAQRHFVQALTFQNDPLAAADKSELALAAGLDALRGLTSAYSQQVLALQRRQTNQVATLVGVNLGRASLTDSIQKMLVETFNTALVPLSWRDIEPREGKRDWTLGDWQIDWCHARGLKVCAGPLVQLDATSLPDWLYIWEGDEQTLQGQVADQLRAVVGRYRGKVHVWLCAARMNVGGALALAEEQRLRLAVLALEVIRQTDPRTPVVLMIDQPWGEFMSHQECDLSPLYFADALVRSDLGLSGIGLEINLGYYPGGTHPRDLLDISRQLERWSCLGLPLLVTLTVPSGIASAPVPGIAQPICNPASGRPTLETQHHWVEQLMPLLLAKPSVHGIIWNQLTDASNDGLPYSGLFDAEDQAKPALTAIRSLLEEHLPRL